MYVPLYISDVLMLKNYSLFYLRLKHNWGSLLYLAQPYLES